jgi:hypothetical protein
MSKSHRHQQSALLDKLVNRARAKEPGLSKQAMVMAYGFEDEGQLNHALSELVACGAIVIDIDGAWPSFRIHKTRLRAHHSLNRPIFLSAGKPILDKPLGDWRKTAQRFSEATAAKTSEPPVDEAAPIAPAPAKATMAVAPKPVRQASKAAPKSGYETDLDQETKRDQAVPFYVGFRLLKEDYNFLHEQMESSGQAVSFVNYARDMLLAELDRRRGPDAAKHKISARVIRTAREEGLELSAFVTSLIEVGLQAREMNRKGF